MVSSDLKPMVVGGWPLRPPYGYPRKPSLAGEWLKGGVHASVLVRSEPRLSRPFRYLLYYMVKKIFYMYIPLDGGRLIKVEI